MKIYSFDEITNEVLVTTLRDTDMLDAVTPSIPLNSIVADAPLPVLTDKQALVVMGERNEQNRFTVTKNVQVIADYRGDTVYSTSTGEQSSIKALGDLPSDVTIAPRPDKYHVWLQDAWQTTPATLAQKAADETAEKQAQISGLLAEATQRVAAYQDLIDFAETPEELAAGEAGYNAWRQYRAALLKYQKGLISELPNQPN